MLKITTLLIALIVVQLPFFGAQAAGFFPACRVVLVNFLDSRGSGVHSNDSTPLPFPIDRLQLEKLRAFEREWRLEPSNDYGDFIRKAGAAARVLKVPADKVDWKYRSEQLSKLSQKAFSIYSDSRRETVLQINYLWAREILEIEAFPPEAYRITSNPFPTLDPYVSAHGSEFLHLTQAYIEKAESFSKLPRSTEKNFGTIGSEEIRELMTHNRWPLYNLTDNHDARHMHFMTRHPRVLEVMFMVARSRNHLRFEMMAGLFEGLDSFKSRFEHRLTAFMAERNYTLEGGILTLALSTEETLNSVGTRSLIEDGGAFTSYRAIFEGTYKNWRPKATSFEQAQALSQETHNIKVGLDLALSDPRTRQFFNYDLNPPIRGASKDETKIHW